MAIVRLSPGRQKSLLRRHPWVFSGAIAEVQGEPASGETVKLLDSRGTFLAWGAFSPNSQIRIRVWSWDEDDQIEGDFLRSRLQNAISARRVGIQSPQEDPFSAIRLVYAESDCLPGLIVDRYGDFLVMQVLSSGIEYWRQEIADILVDLTGIENIYERSDVEVRKLEGLSLRSGVLRGDEPPPKVKIHEGDMRFWVDLRHGHKTGFYLDQRDNRARVRHLAEGRDVLDCFTYTGGFALNALAGDAASVTALDTSEESLSLARQNLDLNNLPSDGIEWLAADVFKGLRKFRDQRRSFDMIVLDPPKFAPTAAQAQRAARGYKDINLLAFKLLRPGGNLITFSCSGGISNELFRKIVAGAALDAGVQAQITSPLFQSEDHPVALNYPEGAYLKGLVLRVGD